MRDMTPEEINAFIRDAAHTGVIASIRKDGRPHAAPIWVAQDGDALLFSSWHESLKVKNIRRDNRVSVVIEDEKPPYAYVIYEGTAQIDEDPGIDELIKWATVIGGKYMGAENAEAYGKRNGVKGELLIRIVPDKVIAKTEIAS